MAARTIKIRHDENTRQKIKTSQIVNRLTGHVLGKVEMVPSQVTAALGLLKKTLPDMAAVQHTGAGGGPITTMDLTKASDEQISALEAVFGPLAEPGGDDEGDQG